MSHSALFIDGLAIAWHGVKPANYEKIFPQVLSELKSLQSAVGNDMSKLVFHTIILTKDIKGPCVHVWTESDGYFHCEYTHVTRWSRLSEE